MIIAVITDVTVTIDNEMNAKKKYQFILSNFFLQIVITHDSEHCTPFGTKIYMYIFANIDGEASSKK